MSTATQADRATLARPVGELMETRVTTVQPGLTVRELTRILADNGISGAPVVTNDGRLLGVVSSSDIVRVAAEESEVRPSSTHWVSVPRASGLQPVDEENPDLPDDTAYGDFFLPEAGPVLAPEWGEEIGDDAFDEFTVADIMTNVPFTVEPTTTLRELASFLVRGRIHRAVVTEEGRLVGIVTTMDVLRALSGEDG